jgi:hypothetical protein
MSGYSKEQLEAILDGLEASIAQVPAPKELELLVPAFESLGLPPVPNPFYPETGKVYIFELLTADQTIVLPNAPEVGFCFDLWALQLDQYGPYRIEVVAPGLQLVVGDCIFGNSAFASTNKFVMDASITSFEAVRFTYLGLFDYTVVGAGIFEYWKMERLDDKGAVTKFVDYATTGPLPSYTSEGEYPDRVLTANAPGPLTIDSNTYYSTGYDRLLIKDEGDQNINGIYRLIQVDPWKLRRASIDQNSSQLLGRGRLIQVTGGGVNQGRQFWRETYTADIEPVAVSEGLVDVLTDNSITSRNAEVGKFYNCVANSLSNNLIFLLPTASPDNLGKEIGFRMRGAWGGYINLSGDVSWQGPLRSPGRSVVLRCIEDSPGTYIWAQVPSEALNVADSIVDNTFYSTDSAWHTIAVYSSPSIVDRAAIARITVLARNIGIGSGTYNDVASFVAEATLVWEAGATTLKDLSFVSVYRDDPTWEVGVTPQPSGTQFYVDVKGAAGVNISWRCKVEVIEQA